MKEPISHWMSFAKCAKEKLPASLTQPICFLFPFMVLVEEVNMTFVKLGKKKNSFRLFLSLRPLTLRERPRRKRRREVMGKRLRAGGKCHLDSPLLMFK